MPPLLQDTSVNPPPASCGTRKCPRRSIQITVPHGDCDWIGPACMDGFILNRKKPSFLTRIETCNNLTNHKEVYISYTHLN